MKSLTIASRVILVVISCQNIFPAETELAHGIQILSPDNNHSFVLNINELKTILDVDTIKDRNVVVFSIAGAFR